jgi:hypothetical protein
MFPSLQMIPIPTGVFQLHIVMKLHALVLTTKKFERDRHYIEVAIAHVMERNQPPEMRVALNAAVFLDMQVARTRRQAVARLAVWVDPVTV